MPEEIEATQKTTQDLIHEERILAVKDAKKAMAHVFVTEFNNPRTIQNTNELGNFYTQLEIELQHQLKKVENWQHLTKQPDHDHFWIKNGELFETFKATPGLHTFRMNAVGMPDNEWLTDTDIDFIEIKYLNR